MAGSRQAPDRSRQRARTRQALVDAATDLLRAGRQPGVADAAEAAGVHRATAYRYFPTPDLLLSEAALTARAPTPQTMVDGVADDDPAALLEAVVSGFATFAFDEEALVRANLRNTVDRWFHDTANGGATTSAPARDTRRFDYLAPVLEAVADRLDAAQASRLQSALALVFGAEAVVVTRDVCRLDPDAAAAVMRWAAVTLLRGALDQAGGASSPPPGRL